MVQNNELSIVCMTGNIFGELWKMFFGFGSHAASLFVSNSVRNLDYCERYNIVLKRRRGLGKVTTVLIRRQLNIGLCFLSLQYFKWFLQGLLVSNAMVKDFLSCGYMLLYRCNGWILETPTNRKWMICRGILLICWDYEKSTSAHYCACSYLLSVATIYILFLFSNEEWSTWLNLKLLRWS